MTWLSEEGKLFLLPKFHIPLFPLKMGCVYTKMIACLSRKETKEIFGFINSFFLNPLCFSANKKMSNGGKNIYIKIQDMSFCSQCLSLLSTPSIEALFPRLTAERLTYITPACTYIQTHFHTHIYTCRFNAESRSETLKCQQSPSDFGGKVWRNNSDWCHCAAMGSCHSLATVARPAGC